MTSVQIVEGYVEASGQAILNRELGLSYTFLRFVRPDKSTLSLENVAVDNEMNSYLGKNSSGTFAYYRFEKVNCICGFKSADRLYITPAGRDPLAGFFKLKRGPAYMFVALGIFMAILSISVGAWLGVLFSAAFFGALVHWTRGFARLSRPSEVEIRQALA